ncbi:MAG: ECF transporter S component, partial [Oscillospiraceae bacterium]
MYAKPDRTSLKKIASVVLILIVIPVTIMLGTMVFDGRKYYIISLLIIIYTLIPFFMIFESRKPKAREIVIIAVLVAIAVAGRAAFFMFPQVKPIVALVIITGVSLGAESGFLMGALTAFVSNFFAGQGPWTPWQMFAFGIIGFLAGILFKEGRLPKTKTMLCIFGAVSTMAIFGIIMNISSALTFSETVTFQMLIASCVAGLPFDAIHAVSTVAFLFILAKPMIKKLERIKQKYGIAEN